MSGESSPASHRKPKMCVEASIEVNNSAPSSPFEAIFGPEGRSLILGPEGHRTSSFGRTKNVRAEVSSTQLQVRKIRPLSFLYLGFPLLELCSRFFLERSRVHFRILISVGTRWRLTVGAVRQNNSKTNKTQSQIILSQFFSKLLFVMRYKIESTYTIFCRRRVLTDTMPCSPNSARR